MSAEYINVNLINSNKYDNSTTDTEVLTFTATSVGGPFVSTPSDYYVAVDSFQVNTNNLPVLVAEPDIEAVPYVADNTIHKVLVLTSGGTIPSSPFNDYIPGITVTDKPAINPPSGNGIGTVVSLSRDGNRVLISAPTNNVSVGIVYIYSWTGTVWYNNGSFTGPNSASGVQFGKFAKLSKSGNSFIFGSLSSTGSAYRVYRANDTTQNTIFTLIRDVTIGAATNVSVAISDDGNTIAIARVNDNTNRGHVEVHRWNNFTWVLRGTIIHGAAIGDLFGAGIDLNGDGTILAVGSEGATVSPNQTNAGNVIVYKFNGVTHEQIGSTIINGITNSKFGGSISLNTDGTIISIGASESTAINGIVSVYKYTPYTNVNNAIVYNWVQLGQSINTTNPPNTSSDLRGYPVSISDDGYTLITGLHGFDGSSINNRGRAEVYRFNGLTWTLIWSINGPLTNSILGQGVAIAGDGKSWIIGIPGVDVLLYQLTQSTEDSVINTALTNTQSLLEQSTRRVTWIPDSTGITAPSRASLNGLNTANFAYYHCRSYERFIACVNTAIRDAYIAGINSIWNNIGTNNAVNAARFGQTYANIFIKNFPTPPFLEWDATRMTADLYVNQLFNNSVYASNNYAIPAITSNYINPVGSTRLTSNNIPIRLQLAFNASLYSLFSTFPAVETIINSEKFYIIDICSSGRDVIIPNPPLLPPTAFQFNTLSNIFEWPRVIYPYSNTYIKLLQESSTVSIWSPFAKIILTTDLPVVPTQSFARVTRRTSQMASTEVITGGGSSLVLIEIPINSVDNRADLLYQPITAAYNRIGLTGTTPITVINVTPTLFLKSGSATSFNFFRGVMSFCKLKFEKKTLISGGTTTTSTSTSSGDNDSSARITDRPPLMYI